MTIEAAVRYIKRMRDDAEFRRILNEYSENEAASWAFVKDAGYDFTMSEFKQAQDEIYKEFGVTPM